MNFKSILQLTIILSFLAIVSCDKIENDQKSVATELLIGHWINPAITDTITTYYKSENLDEKGYGFTFYDNGEFLERKNAGWCGTPPITYANFDGTWLKNDSIIDISVAYWGGIATYQWKIMSIETDELKIYQISADYEFVED